MTPSERMRLSRQRRREGTVLVKLTVPADVVADLVGMGWLRPDAPAAEVRPALVQMLHRAFVLDIRPPQERG